MDFASLKKKALKLKDQAVEKSQQAVDFGAKKLSESGFVLKTPTELEAFIQKSKNSFSKGEQGEKKEYKKRALVIFADTKSDFFEHMLYMLPVLSTKAFSQNIALKLADRDMKELDKEAYKIESGPALCVFENQVLIKTLSGEENIQKVVKSASLDISTTIDSL